MWLSWDQYRIWVLTLPLKTKHLAAIEIFVRGHGVFIWTLPTGSGKSVCFTSLPGLFDRLRQMIKANDHHHSIVVVSPLSALMQDQISLVSFSLYKYIYIYNSLIMVLVHV